MPEWSQDTLAEMAESPIFASPVAPGQRAHIVPCSAERQPLDDRLVVLAECGLLAYCPRTGPFPSPHWRVCHDCARIVAHRCGTPGAKLLGTETPPPRT